MPLLVWVHDGRDIARVLFSRLAPGGPLAWMFGTMVAAVVGYLFGTAIRRASWKRKRAALPRWATVQLHDIDEADVEIRVAPTRRPMAFAVPGRDRHVVVSELVVELPEEQRRAVIAHEMAHLRLRHDRHLLVLWFYERFWGWLPGAHAVVSSHRTSIERWADAVALREEALASTYLDSARRSLAGCEHAEVAAPCVAKAGRSVLHLSGLVIVTGAPVVGGILVASYSVMEIVSVFSSLH